MRVLQLHNVEDTFEGQFVEIKTVADVIIRTDGFGIVVNHHAAPTCLTNGVQGLHTTPVELHAGTDAIGSASQHHHRLLVVRVIHIVFGSVISEVEIVGLCRIFGRQRINLFHHRKDAQPLTQFTDAQGSRFASCLRFPPDGTGYLEIGETLTLGFTEESGERRAAAITVVQFPTRIHDVLQFLQEPFVYLC